MGAGLIQTVGEWVKDQGQDAETLAQASCTYAGGYDAWALQTSEYAFDNLTSAPLIDEGNPGGCCDWCWLCKLAWAHFCWQTDQ